MPESWRRRAADIIFWNLACPCEDVALRMTTGCSINCYKSQSDYIVSIIERHCGEAEKTLRAAAEWASRNDNCPMADLGICEENPECDPGYSGALTGARCWIEYWKKEAALCQSPDK